MSNKLDIFRDMHLTTTKKTATAVKPQASIRHDNMTGRWLTTFQAIFHPELDLFSVGSMSKPRCVEFFDPATASLHRSISADALTAVVSRMAFHPRSDKLILAGGSSSGRVTIVR
jgi:hypothetical protein